MSLASEQNEFIVSTEAGISAGTPNDVRRGFIGWADILGYKSFALNASSEAGAKTVFKVLESLEEKIVDFIENHFIEDSEPYTAIHRFAKWFLFSDTIVFFIPENPLGTSEEIVRGDCASYAAVAMELLQESMLREGLPVRGTLHYGDFYQNGVSFAGKGVMEAATFCDKMEMAGIVVTEAVTPLLRYFPNGGARYDGNSLVRYKVPFRREEKLEETADYTLVKKWIDTKALFLLTDQDELTLAQTDIEEIVKKSFSAHGKSIESPSVQIKIQNTIKFLNGLKSGEVKRIPAEDAPEGYGDF